jgi:hypothetical protein
MRAIAGLSMGAGQTLNFGYKNPKVFTWIGAFSPAPNTTAAGTTIKDMAAVKANVHLNYLAAGTGAAGNEVDYQNRARTYHNYLQQNGVTNLYFQVEVGPGHERENWNRQLYNFAQRIFKGTSNTVDYARIVPVKVSSRSAYKTILTQNESCQKTWGVNIVNTSTGRSLPYQYSLDGRTFVTFNPDRVTSQRIVPIK